MSTMPPGFQGGLEPVARTKAYQRVRESIDPDNFSAGFALWSGTSFAAPLFAGPGGRAPGGRHRPAHDGRKAARARATAAVAEEITAAEDRRTKALAAAKAVAT